VRTRGWQGRLPRDEDEARSRIVAAAARCVDSYGATKTTLSDVASELGVTRQTVYRYFPGIAELLSAVGEAGAAQFLDRLAKHVEGMSDPGEALAEGMVFTLEALPSERYIGLLLQTGQSDVFTRRATSPTAISFGKAVLQRFSVDWAALGFDDRDLEGLAELMLRMLVSFIEYPSDPPRDRSDLCDFLRQWLGPAVSGHAAPGTRRSRTR